MTLHERPFHNPINFIHKAKININFYRRFYRIQIANKVRERDVYRLLTQPLLTHYLHINMATYQNQTKSSNNFTKSNFTLNKY